MKGLKNRRRIRCCVILLAAAASPAASKPQPNETLSVSSPEQLFSIADHARDVKDFAKAEAGYRALSSNPNIEMRTEARFRLGLMLADQKHKYREAAIEFRHILDEKPHAVRVRLELARMQSLLGNPTAARRELRAAEAEGLPAEVERTVRFFANALTAGKRFGGSFEVSIAPDSNINRATRIETLDTVLGSFVLNKDAKARSGVGLASKAQTYVRAPVSDRIDVLFRLSGDGALYRASRYDDLAGAIAVGPELTAGRDRTSLSLATGWRWYGLKPYSVARSANANWLHPIGKRSEVRVDGAVARISYKLNAAQNALSYSVGIGIDRAFGSRFGGGIRVVGQRDAAADPGYATTDGSVRVYAYREIGRTTLVAAITADHLEADERLLLFRNRRVDQRVDASLTTTFRALHFGSVAPLISLGYERDYSTISLYDYSRLHASAGVGAAF
jgi:hypothetical protein